MTNAINRKQLIEEILADFGSIKRKIFSGSFDIAKKLRITLTQWQLLHIIGHHKKVGVKEIAEHLGVTSSAATQMIDNMVGSGLLVREDSQDDRRALNIKVSNQSKKYLKKIREKGIEHLAIIFSALSDKELVKFGKINKKIAEQISKLDKEQK